MLPSIEQLLAGDENVSPSFRRLFATPKPDVLEVALDKQSPRRFTGEPITDFGSFDSERRREIRDLQTADQRRDEREERIQGGD